MGEGLLLTWNPAAWPTLAAAWPTALDDSCQDDWSWPCRRRDVPVGTRVFLLKQGAPPRGIVAAGHTTTPTYVSRHFWALARPSRYVGVRLTEKTALDDPLPTTATELASPRASGVVVSADALERVEQLWARHLYRVAHLGWDAMGWNTSRPPAGQDDDGRPHSM